MLAEAFKLNDNGGPVQPDGAAVQITPTLLLSSAMAKWCSNKTYIVEPGGLEPPTPALQRQCSAS